MPPTDSIPLQIAGYTIFPLSLPPLPAFPHAATHYLYLIPHQPKIPTPTASRSLFLVNVPFDSTEIHIKHLFSAQIGISAGRIEDVQFEGQSRKGGGGSTDEASGSKPPPNKKSKKRKRGSNGGALEDVEGMALPSVWDRELRIDGLTAVVQFVDRASMEAAFKAVKLMRKEQKEPVWGEGLEGKVPALGSARYLNHHNLTYPDKSQLMESVNKYMEAFAEKEASEARTRDRQRQEPDADGFITVTRGGRTNPARQEAAQAQAEMQKKKNTGLEDFYRFQSREKRKRAAAELTRKFEEDKEKIKKLRARRGMFKPEEA